jgi:hypothetical protein
MTEEGGRIKKRDRGDRMRSGQGGRKERGLRREERKEINERKKNRVFRGGGKNIVVMQMEKEREKGG